MTKISMSWIVVWSPFERLPFHLPNKMPTTVLRPRVWEDPEAPGMWNVELHNYLLVALGLKTTTSRRRTGPTPRYRPGRTYPIVPHRQASGYLRARVLSAEPVRLSDTTPEVVSAEGYGWLGMTPHMFGQCYLRFARLPLGHDPALWRYTLELLPYSRDMVPDPEPRCAPEPPAPRRVADPLQQRLVL